MQWMWLDSTMEGTPGAGMTCADGGECEFQLVRGGGGDAGSPTLDADESPAYVPGGVTLDGARMDCSAPVLDRKLCGGGFLVRGQASSPCDASPRFLWEQIPPRLAPSDEQTESLLLPSNDWTSDELDCELEALSETLDPASDASMMPPPQIKVQEPATTEHRPPRLEPFVFGSQPAGLASPVADYARPQLDVGSRVNVNLSSSCSALPATPRRPLHHSGGGLTSGGCAGLTSGVETPSKAECLARLSPSVTCPNVQVFSPQPCRTTSCSGRIKLEISAPCSSMVSVSVRTGPGDCSGDGHMVTWPSRTGETCPGERHVTLGATSCHPRQTCCCGVVPDAVCTVPGPCVAPESPLCFPVDQKLGLLGNRSWLTADAVHIADTGEDDMTTLARATAYLRESGWYYGMLSFRDAQVCLRNTARGTFLVRDSFDRRFLFAITVQTSQGPTSVRVQFTRGRFRLDAPAALLPSMPTFSNVNALVERYARHGHVLYDQRCRPLLKMRLGRPLLRQVPTLQHCCRLAIHGQGQMPEPMPAKLRQYLQQYPFSR